MKTKLLIVAMVWVALVFLKGINDDQKRAEELAYLASLPTPTFTPTATPDVTPTPEPTPTPDLPQVVLGEQLYQQHCAYCHELATGIGPSLKKQVLATHTNAAKLFDYNKKFMPYDKDYKLTDDEYWAVTAYLLARDGFIAEDLTLGPENAESISLKQ